MTQTRKDAVSTCVAIPVDLLRKARRYGISRSGTINRALQEEIIRFERDHPELVEEETKLV